MSVTIEKCMDPRQDYLAEKVGVLIEGPIQNTFVIYPSQNLSTTSSTFNIQPPSTDVGIAKDIRIHVRGSCPIAITNTTGNPITVGDALSGYLGLRCFCLQQNMTSINLLINNTTLTLNPYQYLDSLLHLNNDSFNQAGFLSCSTGLPDFCTNYLDWVNTNRNVLGLWQSSVESDHVAQPRTFNLGYTGSVDGATVIDNDATVTAVVTFETWEPLLCPPFVADGCETDAIRGVSGVTLTFNWANPLGRLFSFAAGVSGIAVVQPTAFTFAQCELHLNYITPSRDSIVSRYGDVNYYNFSSIGIAETIVGSMAPGSTQTVSSQNIENNVVPDLILIYAHPQATSRTWSTPDCFYQISNLSIQYNNKTMLNGIQYEQLFDMSKNNGLSTRTYPEFAGGTVDSLGALSGLILSAAPIVINPSRDLGLEGGMANGVKVKNQLLVTCSITNQSNETLNISLCVVSINTGLLTVAAGQATQEVGLFSLSDSMAQMGRPADVKWSHFRQVASKYGFSGGSSFWRKLWHGIKQVGKYVAPYAKDAAIKAAKGFIGAGAQRSRRPIYY